jgi:hypothetical protein
MNDFGYVNKSKAGSKKGATISIIPIHYGRPRKRVPDGFSLALYGYGFEAMRYLTHEEMAELRDWITNVLIDREDATP